MLFVKNFIFLNLSKAFFAGMLLFLVEQKCYSQSNFLQGQIKDLNGEPIPLVTVELINIFHEYIEGTVSNLHGDFLIEAPIKKSYKLKVSGLGYEEQIIPLNRSEQINIRLQPSNLSEVVELHEFRYKKDKDKNGTNSSLNFPEVMVD